MKKLLLLSILMLGSVSLFAQQPEGQHRVVMQVASSDTLEHKMLMRQLKNMKEASPDMRIEVVCQGPGLDMLMTDRCIAPGKIAEFSSKGIVFLACENTMKDRGVDRSQLLSEAGTVKTAIIHLIERQEDGWSYIKAGF